MDPASDRAGLNANFATYDIQRERNFVGGTV